MQTMLSCYTPITRLAPLNSEIKSRPPKHALLNLLLGGDVDVYWGVCIDRQCKQQANRSFSSPPSIALTWAVQWASELVSTATILVGVSELFAAWKAVYCPVTSATFKLPSGDVIGRAASRGLVMRASSIDGFLQPPASDVDARKCDVSALTPGLSLQR